MKKELDDVVKVFSEECDKAAAAAEAALANSSSAAAAASIGAADGGGGGGGGSGVGVGGSGGVGLFPDGASSHHSSSGGVWSAVAPSRRFEPLALVSETENEDDEAADASVPAPTAAPAAAPASLFPVEKGAIAVQH